MGVHLEVELKIIVGLGNPGEKYAGTKHNIGFEIINQFAKKNGIIKYKSKFQGIVAEINLYGEKVLLLKPLTYMNLSGNSVIEVTKFYKIDPSEDLIVIYDDMDLPVGKLRVRAKGSSGGHNGIKSIISHVGKDFIRIKCGVGKAINKENVIGHVLGGFNKEDSKIIDEMRENACELLDDFVRADDLEKVMRKYN